MRSRLTVCSHCLDVAEKSLNQLRTNAEDNGKIVEALAFLQQAQRIVYEVEHRRRKREMLAARRMSAGAVPAMSQKS